MSPTIAGLLLIAVLFAGGILLAWDRKVREVDQYIKKFRKDHLGCDPSYRDVKRIFPKVKLLPSGDGVGDFLAKRDPHSKVVYFDSEKCQATRRPSSQEEIESLVQIFKNDHSILD